MITRHTFGARARLAAAGLLIGVVVAACGGGTTPAGGGTTPAAGGPAVKIVDRAFNPTTLTVAVGSTVTWTNTGAVAHTVTADDGSFDSNNISAGSTFPHTFGTAGTFTYHCKIHSEMTATITVTP